MNVYFVYVVRYLIRLFVKYLVIITKGSHSLRAAKEEQNIDPQHMTFGFVGLKITKEMVEHVTMNTWQVLFPKHVKVKR